MHLKSNLTHNVLVGVFLHLGLPTSPVIKIISDYYISPSFGMPYNPLSGAEDGKDIGWINSYFGKYTLEGLSNILDLRLSDLRVQNVKVASGIFIDQSNNNILKALSQVQHSTEKMILVPLNLFNKHAVGIIFEKSGDGNSLKITYLDPLNKPIPEDLKQLVLNQLAYEVTFKEITIEQQKYSNCSPEVIENFILYLTGKRVSQEKAIELHSQLVENRLMEKDTILQMIDFLPVVDSHELELLGA